MKVIAAKLPVSLRGGDPAVHHTNGCMSLPGRPPEQTHIAIDRTHNSSAYQNNTELFVVTCGQHFHIYQTWEHNGRKIIPYLQFMLRFEEFVLTNKDK